MRATILPKAHILTKAHRAAVSIMAQGCTASEVFLIFTTQLYSNLCNYNAIYSFTDKRQVLQQEYSPPPILPSHHF